METVVNECITITDPTKEVIAWVKQNLVFENPEYEKKRRMGLWTGKTQKQLRLYEVIGNSIRIPYGCLRNILPLIGKGVIDSSIPLTETVEYENTISLYDYQEQAKQTLINSYYGLLKAAPGAGKTQIALAVIFALKRKALWITHTADLLNQSKRRAEQYIDKSLIGTITEGKVNIGAGVTFATVQTLCNIDLPRYKNEWGVVIVDEAHNVSGTPTTVTRYYKVLNNLSAIYKYGLSATVHRSDGLIGTTKALLGDVVCEISKETIGDRIVDVGIKPVDTELEPPLSVYNTDGTLNYTDLIDWMCTDETRNNLIVGICEHCKDNSILILTDRVSHLETLKGLLGNKVVTIDGKTKKAEREQSLEQMRNGEKKIMIATYSLAKEGLDIPCLERLILATPHKDYAVITQAVGRIARSYPGKAAPIVFDLVDKSPYCLKAYKARRTIYRKNDCYFVGNI